MGFKPRARRSVVVAIDGPAGAGKSTVAKELAARLGYQVLDTGAIYRAVALQAAWCGVPWTDERGCAAIAAGLDIRFAIVDGENRVLVGGHDVSSAIRTPALSEGASQVSSLPAVRAALLELQRRLGAGGGVIAEGRDVGTVVFPAAEAKFYLTAEAEVRASRRHDELISKGQQVELDATLEEMQRRDARDSDRAVAPLAQAEDAVAVDSSGLSVCEVVEHMAQVVGQRERAQ